MDTNYKNIIPQHSPKDYKSGLKPIWCPGCGDYGVLNAMMQAFAKLNLETHEIAVITGIGCSSRLPGYLSTYGFNTLHGRAIPIATGTKLANPDTTVFVAGGDGDGFSIGGGHLPHIARRNIDITYLVMDNRIYGLTKGQMSPTTPLDSYTSTTIYGSYDPPVNMVKMMLAYETGFVARGFAGNIKQLTDLIVQGVQHRGFSFIQVLSPCVTYRGKGEYDIIRGMAADLPDDYDPADYKAARDIVEDEETLHMGVIWRDTSKPTYDERIKHLNAQVAEKGYPDKSELVNIFRP